MKLVRQPKSDLNVRPFMVIWETTQACDLACRHCRAQAIPEHAPDILTLEEGKDLLRQVESFGKPYPLFILTGGDPFKREDIFELVRFAATLGLPVAVSPSGTPLLNIENLYKLKETGVKAISLSIDGSTAEKHDHFRGVPGSFDITINGWKYAREINLKLQLNTTVTRYNIHDLPDIFSLVQSLGAMTWSLFFLVPTGRGNKEDEISPAEFEAVMHFLYDLSKFISAKTTEGHHYKRIVLQRAILEGKNIPLIEYINLHPVYYELKEKLDQIVDQKSIITKLDRIRRTPMHINSGNGLVFIDLKGEVFPSGFLPISTGNIREHSLVDIYRQAPLLRSLRDPSQLEGRCGLCEFVSICGGSRSRAFAMTGNPLAEEPFCSYEPGSFPFQAELQKLLQEEN